MSNEMRRSVIQFLQKRIEEIEQKEINKPQSIEICDFTKETYLQNKRLLKHLLIEEQIFLDKQRQQ